MDIISQLLPFVFLIAIMYFVIIRPQQNEAKAKKAMLEALKKGTKLSQMVVLSLLFTKLKKVL